MKNLKDVPLTEKSLKKSQGIQTKSHQNLNVFELVSKLGQFSPEEKAEAYSSVAKYLLKIIKYHLNSDLIEVKLLRIIEAVSKFITAKTVAKEEVLFSKGEKISGLYILTSGRIGLTKKNKESLEIIKKKVNKKNISVDSF